MVTKQFCGSENIVWPNINWNIALHCDLKQSKPFSLLNTLPLGHDESTIKHQSKFSFKRIISSEDIADIIF